MGKRDSLYAKMVLKYLNDLRGIPQRMSELVEYVDGRTTMPSEAEVRNAVEYLKVAELVEDSRATEASDESYKITAEGMRQADRRVPPGHLDPVVWPEG